MRVITTATHCEGRDGDDYGVVEVVEVVCVVRYSGDVMLGGRGETRNADESYSPFLVYTRSTSLL